MGARHAPPTIRECAREDAAALDALYADAFPDEDFAPLVRALLAHPAAHSFVAAIGGATVGHVALTECSIADGRARIALLGPLAVLPFHQRGDIGRALVNEGIARMEDAGFGRTVLLGDPVYYGPFGFRVETSIEPPYLLPLAWTSAWQSRGPYDVPSPAGRLVVLEPWRKPELWRD